MDTIEIPKIPSTPAMYIFYLIKGEKEVPFYVGQTKNLKRRMGEYLVSSWATTPDFIVGEATKYLQEKGYQVVVKFQDLSEEESERRLKEEKKIKELKSRGQILLNRDADKVGYDYRTADREEIRSQIRKEVEDILQRSV